MMQNGTTEGEDVQNAAITYVSAPDYVSLRDTGNMFGIPKSTLSRKVDKLTCKFW
jgi:hypothetical protein